MRQIIRTVMPLNDGNIDSENNFHNDDCANSALEDVTPARLRVTGVKWSEATDD